MSRIFLHVTSREALEHARDDGAYRSASLSREGFIHCCLPSQLGATAKRHFAGQDGLVVLVVDAGLVTAPVRHEDTSGRGEEFPHVYGPLNLDAVIDVVDFPRGTDGSFPLPARLASLCP